MIIRIMKTIHQLRPLRGLLFGFSLLMFCGAAMAHEGHNHGGPVSMKRAQELGLEAAASFAIKDPGFGFGSLAKSWQSLTAENSQIHTNGRGYYIVAVSNPQEKRTLFVLLSLMGKIENANFSGEFEKLPAMPGSPAKSAEPPAYQAE